MRENSPSDRIHPASGNALSGQDGAVHIAMAGLLLLLAIAAAGVHAVARDWQRMAELQLRLSECVGRQARELRDVLENVEGDNTQIRWIRASIASATIAAPELLPALRAALRAKVLQQDARLAAWKVRRGIWLARLGCGKPGDWPRPLPRLPWVRPLPDAIGSKPLAPEPGQPFPARFRIEVHHLPRAAAAEVRKPETGAGWSASWARPRAWRI